MGLSKPKSIFGIYGITPYSLADGLPYGALLVTGGGNLEMTAEKEELYGGSSRYAYASETTSVATNLTANVKTYEDFLMELFLGAAVNTLVPSSTGEVRAFENVKGTSVKNDTTGIVSVTVKATKKGDLKYGRYVIKALSASTVQVYAHSGIDFSRGTKATFNNDALAIGPVLTVGVSPVELVGFGVEITKGSGTLAMITGETAAFTIFPPYSAASIITVGSSTSDFPNFGARMLAAKSDNRIFEINAFNCKGSGLPLPLQEKAFAISDLTMTLLNDPNRDAVCEITWHQGE